MSEIWRKEIRLDLPDVTEVAVEDDWTEIKVAHDDRSKTIDSFLTEQFGSLTPEQKDQLGVKRREDLALIGYIKTGEKVEVILDSRGSTGLNVFNESFKLIDLDSEMATNRYSEVFIASQKNVKLILTGIANPRSAVHQKTTFKVMREMSPVTSHDTAVRMSSSYSVGLISNSP